LKLQVFWDVTPCQLFNIYLFTKISNYLDVDRGQNPVKLEPLSPPLLERRIVTLFFLTSRLAHCNVIIVLKESHSCMRFSGLIITFTDLNAVYDLIYVNDFICRVKIERALNPVQRIACNFRLNNEDS